MEDIFYLSKLPVGKSDIIAAAVQSGLKSEELENEDVRIIPESDTYWDFDRFETEADMRCLDDEDLKRLRSLKPGSTFIVTHHYNTRKSLVGFLHKLMTQRGGWVTLDLEEIYDKEALQTFIKRHCSP